MEALKIIFIFIYEPSDTCHELRDDLVIIDLCGLGYVKTPSSKGETKRFFYPMWLYFSPLHLLRYDLNPIVDRISTTITIIFMIQITY